MTDKSAKKVCAGTTRFENTSVGIAFVIAPSLRSRCENPVIREDDNDSPNESTTMRQWDLGARPPSTSPLLGVLTNAMAHLGQSRFDQTLLDSMYPVLPAASWSVYRTGPLCEPAIFMSASHGVPDTTRDCWRAYLSGPYRSDCTLLNGTPGNDFHSQAAQISHITAQEVPPEHRAKVYEAHGMAERVSIVERQGEGALFAINFYRHQHQRPFEDAQISALEHLAPALLAMAHKHLEVWMPNAKAAQFTRLMAKLQAMHAALTPRECQVCAGMLQGLTFDGIACQLGLSVTSVKTYRNRAFARLGIHFRNELFALMLAC
jgi:DNA-binding CsgD family transcriptional regulator